MHQNTLVLVVMLLWAVPVHAAGFADLPQNWKDVSLLTDRIHVDVPEAAQVVPPTYSIMEAPSPPEKEVRVIVDAGPARLVMFVSELFRVAPADFIPLGTAYIKELERRFRFDELSVSPAVRPVNGLDLLEYEPRGKATVPGAHLIKGLLVRQADGSLQSIGFFVNDPGLADLPAARQLVSRVIASLKGGARRLASGARVQLVGTPLTLELPSEYTAYTQRGPDFDVYWVEHLVPIDRPAGRLGIYLGHHPQRPAAPVTARSVRAILFGVNAEWRAWEAAGDSRSPALLRQEAFVKSPDGGREQLLHIFFYAVSETERAAFQRIGETASLH